MSLVGVDKYCKKQHTDLLLTDVSALLQRTSVRILRKGKLERLLGFQIVLFLSVLCSLLCWHYISGLVSDTLVFPGALEGTCCPPNLGRNIATAGTKRAWIGTWAEQVAMGLAGRRQSDHNNPLFLLCAAHLGDTLPPLLSAV